MDFRKRGPKRPATGCESYQTPVKRAQAGADAVRRTLARAVSSPTREVKFRHPRPAPCVQPGKTGLPGCQVSPLAVEYRIAQSLYLRGSRNAGAARLGETLWHATERITPEGGCHE